jgi:hypothetical protein
MSSEWIVKVLTKASVPWKWIGPKMLPSGEVDDPDLERQFECLQQDVDAGRTGAWRHVEFQRHAAREARIMQRPRVSTSNAMYRSGAFSLNQAMAPSSPLSMIGVPDTHGSSAERNSDVLLTG